MNWRELLLSLRETEPVVLCRVVYSQGSVPRRDFPLMVVPSRGPIQGTLGGGGLEQQVIQRARQLTTDDTPEIMEFQLNATDVNSEGSLCGGSALVLLEPWPTEATRHWQSLAAQARDGEQVLVHSIQLTSTVTIQRRLWPVAGDEITEIKELAQQALEAEEPRAFRRREEVLLADPLVPEPVLHLFGAGHVGQAVAHLASWLGWPITVYDDRSELLTKERFPLARLVAVDYNRLENLPLPAHRDLILVATRDHRLDRMVLEHLLQVPVRYVGLVSSRRKWHFIREALRQTGLPLERVEQVHAPVGLDLGAETVPEIALSILAQMVQVRKNRRRSNDFQKTEQARKN